MQKVLEERLLHSRVELTLQEVYSIVKKEFHDTIIDLMKRKRLSVEPESEKPVKVKAVHIERWQWRRNILTATIETSIRISDMKKLIVELKDHGSEIKLMSMDFYKNGKWPSNTNLRWRIRAATHATEELHSACPNLRGNSSAYARVKMQGGWEHFVQLFRVW